MQRCLDLAQKGAGYVAPNPMVGAVLVYGDSIIGEGWHQQFGQSHAEVNAIRDAVNKGNESLISRATLYVSLEPCAHHGKTPPCDQLIIEHKIPRVVIGCRDPFPDVNGKGIENLIKAGIDVKVGVLETDCKKINKRFFCFHLNKRPYIILKWAQTADGLIGSGTTDRLMISGAAVQRLVHRWRSEEAAIMAGSRTIMLDNPQLTNRSGAGAQPVRVVLDRELQLNRHFHVFDGSVKTIILNQLKTEQNTVHYYRINPDKHIAGEICDALLHLQLQSVLIEGGAQLLSFFIESGIWDEARVITHTSMNAGEGVHAPDLKQAVLDHTDQFEREIVYYYQNKNH